MNLKELVLIDVFRSLSTAAQNGVLRVADDLARMERRTRAPLAARRDQRFQDFLRRAGIPPR